MIMLVNMIFAIKDSDLIILAVLQACSLMFCLDFTYSSLFVGKLFFSFRVMSQFSLKLNFSCKFCTHSHSFTALIDRLVQWLVLLGWDSTTGHTLLHCWQPAN